MSTVLELYEKLKPKLGDEESRALLEFVEGSVERRAATKEDLKLAAMTLKEEIADEVAAIKDEIAILKTTTATKEELQRVERELRKDIHQLDQKIEATKADLIKWAFGFWIGNVAVLSGIVFAIVRSFAGK